MPREVRDDPSDSRRGARRRDPSGRDVPETREGMTDSSAADDCPYVRRLSSPAMMADLLGVPPAAVRHWIRSGLLEVAERSGSLEWLDYGQLVAGRGLAALLNAGLSLREIDAQLAGLAVDRRAVAAGRVVIDGRRLAVARDGMLLGAGGQMHLGFYTELGRPEPGLPAENDEAAAIVMFHGRPGQAAGHAPSDPEGDAALPGGDVVAEILDLADDLEAAGEYAEAAEALRAVLQAQGPTAEITFVLAELLYRAGDLTAARERYYAAIELDPEHLRARASLGCVLGELGEPELAVAALEGVLRQEPEYADAHWHMAGVLEDLGRPSEARRHLRRFVDLAPHSPWAEAARHKLESDG